MEGNQGKFEDTNEGKRKRLLYNYGLPFSKELAYNIDQQILRVKNKKASLIIVDGGIGEGKTTLKVHIADYINGAYPLISEIKGDYPELDEEAVYGYDETKTIKFKNQMAMGGEEFPKKLGFCFEEKLPVVIYDEAGDFARRGALTKLNSMLNGVFEKYRGLRIVVIMGLPSLRTLDSSVMDKCMVRVGLHCEGRNDLYGNFKGYSAYRLNYVLHKMNKLIVKVKAYSFTVPNIRGHFLDLPELRSEALDKFSTLGKKNSLRVNELKFKGFLTYQDMAKQLRRSVNWVKAKVNEKKIPEVDKYKNAKYFDRSVLDSLAEEL